MKNGNPAKIDDADKFETVAKAKKELKNYDEDFNGAIYKVKEYRSINLEKMEDQLMEEVKDLLNKCDNCKLKECIRL